MFKQLRQLVSMPLGPPEVAETQPIWKAESTYVSDYGLSQCP